MNLVIDDAVEVKQVTKTNSEEKRRSLGLSTTLWTVPGTNQLTAGQAKFS